MVGIEKIGKPDDKFQYNKKEKEESLELLWNDHGARHLDLQLCRWNGVDALATQMSRFSPYVAMFDNPLRFIDPDGMKPVDDYFDQKGNYLGKDNAKTDNVRIIDKNIWDMNKVVDNGVESIEYQIGQSFSVAFSVAGLDDKSSLNVYQYYNPTDLILVKNSNIGGKEALTFSLSGTKSNHTTVIKVAIENNNKTKVSDNSKEIISSFEHEETHYQDYKVLGFENYVQVATENPQLIERREIQRQIDSPTFRETRLSFQKSAYEYGKKNGLLLPIKISKIK